MTGDSRGCHTPKAEFGMARTHGTRSAYNAGCRCDACREATRVARARQREVQAWGPSASVPGEGENAVALKGGRGVGLALAGVAALSVGGYALWHGWTLQAPDEANPEEPKCTRRTYLLAGTALVVLGLAALVWVSRASAGAD
jgi:hypothetical protein